MTEWFPCCIKQFLLCQHLSWMLRMFSWCIHESYFAVIIACMAAFFETSSWLLISVILLFSLVARRGCPCLTNQVSFKADGETTSCSRCTVKCLVAVNCAERREGWGEQNQHDCGGGNCSSAAGRKEGDLPYKCAGLWGAAQERQEEKGQRKGIARMQQNTSDGSQSLCCPWSSLYIWPKDSRVVEWFGLEGTFTGHLVQTTCKEQGYLQLDQVAESPVQPDLERFQRWGIYNISGLFNWDASGQSVCTCVFGVRVFPWIWYCIQLLSTEESSNAYDLSYNYRWALPNFVPTVSVSLFDLDIHDLIIISGDPVKGDHGAQGVTCLTRVSISVKGD